MFVAHAIPACALGVGAERGKCAWAKARPDFFLSMCLYLIEWRRRRRKRRRRRRRRKRRRSGLPMAS